MATKSVEPQNSTAAAGESRLGVGPQLPTALAFVVQLAAGSDIDGGHLLGRVEHVRSGRRVAFASAGELIDRLCDLVRSTGSATAAPSAASKGD
jgi:hypothetical protein